MCSLHRTCQITAEPHSSLERIPTLSTGCHTIPRLFPRLETVVNRSRSKSYPIFVAIETDPRRQLARQTPLKPITANVLEDRPYDVPGCVCRGGFFSTAANRRVVFSGTTRYVNATNSIIQQVVY